MKTLEKAYEVSSEVGLSYAYKEKTPVHNCENTHCPNCSAFWVKHLGSEIKRWRLTKDLCCPDYWNTIGLENRFNPGGFSYPPHIDLTSFR